MAVFSSHCLYIIFLGALITAVCAMPLPLNDQVIINNNNVPSLNDALVADSDEDVLFDEFWQEDEDDDDDDGFNFIYNLFGDIEPEKKEQQRIQDDIQSAMMMVSSSSDDHVIEMAIISRAKQTFRRSSAEEQDELDLMSSDT